MTATAPTPTLPPCAFTAAPYARPSRAEVLAMRQRYTHPALFTLYKEPLMIVDGHMQYLFDETGRRYLDLFAGIVTVSVGHSHPRVVARVQEQVARLMHTTTIYLHPNIGLFAKALAERMPAGLDVTYFVNSGSEANDLAITMARLYTGNQDVIAVRNAYHGGSPTTMGVTSHHTWKFPTQQSANVHHAINPDPYRSPFSGTPEEIAIKSAADIRDMIRFSTPGAVAAFIAEPIQGVGGVTLGAPNYLREAYGVIREYGGLCIADEVQTGFGRTGTNYWGFQNWGVIPDIVTMAKGIGNGAPLAAVTTRREIAEALTGGSTSTPSAAIRSRWPRGSPCSSRSMPTGCRKIPAWSAGGSRRTGPPGRAPTTSSATCGAWASCSAWSWSRTARPRSPPGRRLSR